MAPQSPPPLPEAKRSNIPLPIKILLLGTGLAVVCVLSFIGLRIFGLVIPFSIPTDGMSPAISRGDHIVMEDLTYRKRKPVSGEILVFKTDGLASERPGQVYEKRLVGLPGDRVSISNGAVLVNGVRTPFRNRDGEIAYVNLPITKFLSKEDEAVTVPDNCYFVLGDNSPHSGDSRSWGCVPAASVIGRVAFCYWPPKHIGAVQ